MKRLTLIFMSIVLLCLSNIINAHTSDFFVGDWNVVIEGTPNGETKMVIHLERKDGKLTGEVRNEAGEDATNIARIDEKESTITIYYSAGGYDVNLWFKKVDDNNIKGSLMDMFNAKGNKIVE